MATIDPEARLAELGLALPEPAKPVAAYIPARRAGNLLFIAGQIPLRAGKLIAEGPIPSKVSLEQGRECARQCSAHWSKSLLETSRLRASKATPRPDDKAQDAERRHLAS